MARAAAAIEALKLTTAVESLPGVMAARGAAMRMLGIPTLAHLIHYLPFRHERVEAETPIESLKAGTIVTASGEVTATRVMLRGRRPRFEAVLLDRTGRLDLVFFNQQYLTKQIEPGDVIRVQGKANRFGPGGQGLQLVNPKWWRVKEDDEAPKVGRLRPVYPASEGAPSAFIDGVIQKVLDRALPMIEDHLGEAFRRERSLPELREAYRMIHRPSSQADVDEARRRLIYDELLLLQLGVRMKREYVRKSLHAPPLKWSKLMDERIRARVPFKLTAGQEKVVREIREDIGRSTPANRLIQGDVGSGKTAVAVYAMLMAVASKRQAALMAPTQLLAEQHYATITSMLEGSKVRVALVTGADRAGRRNGRGELGEFDIAIGTHALLSEGVKFESLAVAVIDEQHRFGVHQRARLRERSGDEGSSPHVLVMTATPIPRTLSLTIFGDLDVSVIRGLPPGRAAIASRAVAASRAGEVFEYVRRRVEKGEQAYVVTPTIGAGDMSTADAPDDDPGLRAVKPTMEMLERGAFKGLRLAALHGRLKRETREAIMARFRAGEIDALIATTVIEVGVDVPNATVMVVNHAERFGLAQLHQLRGRVGRGSKSSLAVFIHDDEITPDAKERLKAVVGTTDGFKLAERDFELRGPGEMMGARQSGEAPFRLAQFPRDMELLTLARRDAAAWIARSPELRGRDEKLVHDRLMKTHGESLGLADVG